MLSVLARFWLFSIVLAFALLAPGQASADPRLARPDRIVVFGDSLSDPGNVFLLNGGQVVAPPDYGMDGLDALGIPEVIALIPDAPYRSRHFSNGATWVELFARAMGRASNARPAIPGALFGTDDGPASNYAWGGATAADLGRSQFPLGAQVDLFLADVRGQAPANALYIVEFGGNDLRAALAAALAGQDPAAVIGAALNSIAANVGKLYQAGARRFLIWNAPDLGRTPALRRLDALAAPGIAALATNLSTIYNLNFQGVVHDLGQLPGISILQFNVAALLAEVQADPGKFGLLDATSACIQPDVPAFGFPSAPPFRCALFDGHFFWDGIHPTRAGHAVIASLVGTELVKAVLQDD